MDGRAGRRRSYYEVKNTLNPLTIIHSHAMKVCIALIDDINHHLEGTQLVDSSANPNFLPPLHHACGLKEAMLACILWLQGSKGLCNYHISASIIKHRFVLTQYSDQHWRFTSTCLRMIRTKALEQIMWDTKTEKKEKKHHGSYSYNSFFYFLCA